MDFSKVRYPIYFSNNIFYIHVNCVACKELEAIPYSECYAFNS